MKKPVRKNIKPSSKIKDYHQEIIVEPAKRLFDALLKAEQREMTVLSKVRKTTILSR